MQIDKIKTMDAIIDKLLQLTPLWVIIIFGITVWGMRFYYTRFKKIENKVEDANCSSHGKDISELKISAEKLPCEKHKENIRIYSEKHNGITDIVNSNNEMLVEISKWVMKTDADMIDKLAKKASPLKMTSVGEIVFNESGAERATIDNIDFLIEKMELINPQTAYDVESSALTVLLQNMGHTLFNSIKNYLYNSPEQIRFIDPVNKEVVDIELSIQIIIKLMSIRLRDEYLKIHTEVEERK